MTIVAIVATLLGAGRIDADQASCSVVGSGGQVGVTPGSIMVVGQTAIGFSSNASTNMYAGHIHCLSADIPVGCLIGDVDNNGKIDGADIDEYLMVYINGTGTPQQICAANIEVNDFVALLLAQ